tara:strand:- start:1639 stop:1896 length:258 start_codon:yes stop_codon:yes gene_type:complete
MSNFLSLAILAINKDAMFTIPENNINKIVWLDGTKPIEKADIEKKITELETEDSNNKKTKVSGLRKMNLTDAEIELLYPDLKEYL